MTMRDKLELLDQRRAESELGGGEARLKAQHEKGKLSARERLELLLDEGSFVELDRFVLHRSVDFGIDAQKFYGDAVYSPAITDFTYMVRGTSYMFVTGPNVVKTVTHEDVTMEDLGGADAHSAKSGVAHFAFDSEPECLQRIRDLFRFIPSNNLADPPRGSATAPRDRRDESLLDVVPDNATKP